MNALSQIDHAHLRHSQAEMPKIIMPTPADGTTHLQGRPSSVVEDNHIITGKSSSNCQVRVVSY